MLTTNPMNGGAMCLLMTPKQRSRGTQKKREIIPSFPDYLVSNLGRVKTIARKLRYTHAVTGNEHYRLSSERFLKVQHNNLTGYKFHQLYRDQKMHNKTIHSLVADAFLDKIPGLDYINHIDGNKHNNIVANLERCTNEYNHEHATKTGLKAKGEQVKSSKLNIHCIKAIKHLLNVGYSHTDLSKMFDISRATISLISQGKIWKHVSQGKNSK